MYLAHNTLLNYISLLGKRYVGNFRIDNVEMKKEATGVFLSPGV
jgi:hypothetical protein